MESAGAVDAKNAPTAPWKTHDVGFPQIPQALITLAIESEVTTRPCRRDDQEDVSFRPRQSV